MPYIKKERRQELWNGDNPKNAGELNFCFTSLIIDYLQYKAEPKYKDYNDIVGALENCKLELYRRKIAPYEDKKIEENGDVY